MFRNLLGVTCTMLAVALLSACDSGSTNTTGNPNLEKPREQTQTPAPPPGEGLEPAGKADSNR